MWVYGICMIIFQCIASGVQMKELQQSMMIKHTSNCDQGAVFDFVGLVVADTVVSPTVLSSHTFDFVGSTGSNGGLGGQKALCLSVIPGEVDGWSSLCHAALKNQVLPLRDRPIVGLDHQNWVRHRHCNR